jgi:LysR family transcriptional regulator, glycine cleavage system transcriptional activator
MPIANLPSLNSLRAFATVAETGSYTRAGGALNVSHAAVNQQVKALEGRLGVTLVVRQGRGIALTDEGVALARDLAAGFATIQRGVEALTRADAARPVQVTMSPVFAVKWLMPRLMDFQQKHPEITLMLNPTGVKMDLRQGGIDMAIRYCDRRVPVADPILTADLVVVATPALIDGRQITDPAMLVDLPWLQELGTNEVGDWFARHGITPDESMMITHMPGNLIMDAVLLGDGVTLTMRPWVEAEIQSGELLELFSDRDFGTFHVETGPGAPRPPVRTFVKWLKHQAAMESMAGAG